MGSNGARSGIRTNGRPYEYVYGEEFSSIGEPFGDVKFIKYNSSTDQFATPMETRTPVRIYAAIDRDNEIKSIIFFDENGMRQRQMDLKGQPHDGMLPHTHYGYWHDENGTYQPTPEELALAEQLVNDWKRRQSG